MKNLLILFLIAAAVVGCTKDASHNPEKTEVSTESMVARSSTDAFEQYDPSTAEGAIALQRKMSCSLIDSEAVTFVWYGKGYSRVPGERDRHIFNLEGMNVRQCHTLNDPIRGEGYRHVSRELMLYLDPITNEVLDKFENPWSGESNEVIHVANDPVNSRPSFGRAENGEIMPFKYRKINDAYLISYEVPLFYRNPLGGEYQKYVGGTYHATEIFDFNGDLEELLDKSKSKAYPVVSWVRLAKWLPWMEMGDRSGLLYFNAMGRKLRDQDQLSVALKSALAGQYSSYSEPPPIEDDRPNETSWTYMKKIIDARAKN